MNAILLIIIAFATLLPIRAEKPETAVKVQCPPFTPQLTLDASFVDKTRYAIFENGEKTDLWLRVLGWRKDKEEILWEVRDFEGKVKDSGTIEVPAGEKPWEGILSLNPYGYGYFEVDLRLKHADISVPRAGSRPAGYVSYGVLPDIERLPLQWVDDSRFGAQGTNFLETGKFMQGNPYQPLYPTLGMVWVYDGYRMSEREGKGPGSFKPITDPEIWKTRQDYWAQTGLCPLIDLHGLPEWLVRWPEEKAKSYSGPTNSGQAYAPNDWDTFANYIRNVAKEQVARKKALFPKLKHNYYQIHWEPDWHWKGEDKDFIRMYEVAHHAIHEVDPDGVLLGPNYGVLQTGNEHLERLFQQGLGKYLDGIATHTYYIPFGFPEPRGLPEQMRNLVRMTREYLPPGAKIINTEWGTNYHGKSVHKDPGVLRDEMTEFMRGHLITLGEGLDCTWYFYTADHSTGGMMYNLTTPNPVFGATWISPKPVAMAAGTATKLLEGTKTLGPVTFLDENVMAYLFDRDGNRLLALWSPDGENRDIELLVGEATVIHYDVMGNASPIASVGGIATVTVNDAPSYVVGLPPALYSTKTLAGDPIPQALPGEDAFIPGLSGSVLAFRHRKIHKLEAKDGKLTLPRNIPPGDWLIIPAEDLAKTPNLSTLLHVQAPVSITEKKGEASAGFPFELKNLLPTDVEGMLRLRGSGKLVSDNNTITLKPGTSATVTLPAKTLASAGGQTPVIVEFVDKMGVISPGPKLQGRFTNAAMSTSSVETDGLMKDWLLEMFTTFNTAADMRGGASEWEGPEDLMFRIGFRYDANRLYIGIKVRDQSHVQEKDGAANWQQDSVQIGIASVPGEKGWQYAQKLAISLRDGDGIINVFREPHTSGLAGGAINPSKFKTKVTRQGDETFYFLAIPWEEIVPGQKGIPEARRIAVGVFVNDVDRIGNTLTKRKMMEGFGDGMSFFLPENFTTVNLSGEP